VTLESHFQMSDSRLSGLFGLVGLVYIFVNIVIIV
jgi:hypothetical protein